MCKLTNSVVMKLGFLMLTTFCGIQPVLGEGPLRAAFFYGYPSLVNGMSGNTEAAAQFFSAYDLLVFGDGVEFPNMVRTRKPVGVGLDEYTRSKQILGMIRSRNPRSKTFGYICLGDSQRLSNSEIRRRIFLWKALPVDGVFLDEAGYDWRIVTRSRQNFAIRTAHEVGLHVMMNSYYPGDLLKPQRRLKQTKTDESSALVSTDWIVLESFPVERGHYESAPKWKTRMRQALDVRRTLGAKILSLSTSDDRAPIASDQRSYASWLAWMLDFEAIAWGEPDYSATSNRLPRVLYQPTDLPEKLDRIVEIRNAPDVFARASSSGMVILDTENKNVMIRRTVGNSRVSTASVSRVE